ncbi:polysaccharide pyruvyl transferase family protein [uncultured Bacteroides sp.]|uniref:polysaccharide pyruvyl transferase family protein n=1 Tax=uncultured Bacteroides sp. TaxID=162156 RepID=UPI0025D8E49A|nr:polysaccharide pyruvyl transferase family protein [uncultured Bacteroides sp.]
MKHVSLITIHVGANFGSILQAIATTKVLEKHNCTVEIVNYIPDRSTLNRLFSTSIKTLRLFIRMFITLPVFLFNRHIYSSFLAKYVRVSEPIYKKDDFVNCCPQANFYITGSDQVWNSKHNEGLDKRYYFDSFPQGTTKIAYASSIGREALEIDEYEEIKKMLATYKAISVREASAKKIIEKMGYEVTHLLDPTFMLDKEAWTHYMSERIINVAYLLVYLPYNIHDKRTIYQSVRKVAEKNKLKVVAFSWHIIPEKYADKTIYFANPGDFLSLVNYADYVVTNSFHGTAFSVNLNKQFIVYLPTGFGTRIKSILGLCHLENRLLQSSEVIADEMMNSWINYAPINMILNKEREKAHAFLRKALGD